MKKLKVILMSLISLVLLLGMITYYRYRQPYVEVSYCKGISKKLKKLDLEYYILSSVKYAVNDTEIRFFYDLKDYDDFEESKCVYDIIKVRNSLQKYIETENTNCLNTQRISIQFNTLPGDYSFLVSNYYGENATPEEFVYYSSLHTDISNAAELCDAKRIGFNISSAEELKLLENWENLEYINVIGPDISIQEKQYMSDILPECQIIYNNENIGNNQHLAG